MALTATLANVAASATSVALFSDAGSAGGSMAPRQAGAPDVLPPSSRQVVNDSTAILYLKFGTTASTTSYTVQIPAGGYFEFPLPTYPGVVHGIWSSATGSARTTEVA